MILDLRDLTADKGLRYASPEPSTFFMLGNFKKI